MSRESRMWMLLFIPDLGHCTKEFFLHLKIPVVIKTEQFCSLLAFPIVTLSALPNSLCANLQRVYQNFFHTRKDQPRQQNTARWSICNVVGPVVAPAALDFMLSLFHNLSFFLTTTNNKIIQQLCPTQWPTFFPMLKTSGASKTGNNPQTFRKQKNTLDAFTAVLLGNPTTMMQTQRPRLRMSLCSLTPSGLKWNKKCSMI